MEYIGITIGALPEAVGIWLMRIIWAIEVGIAFGLLITVHEFGHYISGKLTGMKVEEFSIGFGKRLLGWKKGETEYSIRIFPFGGFCRIFGMDEELEKEEVNEDAHRAFNKRPLWARFLVIIAGSAMNIVLAIILVSLSGMIIGFNYSLISEVRDGSPAHLAGIQAGDKLRLFGYNSRPGDIGDVIRNSNPARGVKLQVINDEGAKNVVVHPAIEIDEQGQTTKRIGITFDENGNYSPKIDIIMFDSPYANAGLMTGDIIREVNGEKVTGIATISRKMLETPGDSAELTIDRDGKEFKFNITGHKIPRTGMVADTIKTDNGYELEIKNVIFETPAFSAMLKPGMRVTEVDGKPIDENFVWSDYEMQEGPILINMKVYDPQVQMEPVLMQLPRVMLHPGISYKADWIRVPPGKALIEGVQQAKTFGMLIFDVLAGLFTKKTNVAELSGPVGIITFTYRAASWGIINLIIITTLISVNLGIVNLLPFPGLDGGRAVFLIGEMIWRRPIMNARMENIIHLVGFFVLIGFILFVTFFDFSRLTSSM